MSEEQVDESRVTLRLYKSADGLSRGCVSTLAVNEQGKIEMMSTESAEMLVDEAATFARQLADFKEQHVDVLDQDEIWPEHLGPLGNG